MQPVALAGDLDQALHRVGLAHGQHHDAAGIREFQEVIGAFAYIVERARNRLAARQGHDQENQNAKAHSSPSSRQGS